MDSLDKDRLRAEIRLMRDQAAYEATGPSRSSMRPRTSYSTATRGMARPTAAITIGMAAVGKGKTARFFTVAELVMHLVETNRCGRTERQLTDIGKADLLILDELGYMPPNIEGARLPYQVMANACEKQGAVITTNIEFSKWGTAFGDDKLTVAIDRVVRHGRLAEFNGASHRMEAALTLGKPGN